MRLTTDEEQKHQHPRPLSLACPHSLQMGPRRLKRSFSIYPVKLRQSVMRVSYIRPFQIKKCSTKTSLSI